MDFSADAIAFLVSGIILLKKATDSDNWVTFPLLSSKDLTWLPHETYIALASREALQSFFPMPVLIYTTPHFLVLTKFHNY